MSAFPKHPIYEILKSRIAIIDGAMGTTIRTYGMEEADIRGERFKDAKKDLLNNGDLFTLTQPEGMDKAGYPARWQEFHDIVHGVVRELRGSISAE